jgi:hypothetical protein
MLMGNKIPGWKSDPPYQMIGLLDARIGMEEAIDDLRQQFRPSQSLVE